MMEIESLFLSRKNPKCDTPNSSINKLAENTVDKLTSTISSKLTTPIINWSHNQHSLAQVAPTW